MEELGFITHKMTLAFDRPQTVEAEVCMKAKSLYE